ncbi:hypothetical protein KM043_009505 [Ampulex compressa]|nr:hypothetical protein KM043_009505 [Ampulex compressa]
MGYAPNNEAHRSRDPLSSVALTGGTGKKRGRKASESRRESTALACDGIGGGNIGTFHEGARAGSRVRWSPMCKVGGGCIVRLPSPLSQDERLHGRRLFGTQVK